LNSRWDLELFSKPCRDGHWIIPAAAVKSASKKGTIKGGTSQGLILS
jgi:hypothetical protein